MTDPRRGVVAYILKGYPRLSETFIANEIRLLESMGMALRLFSVKRGDALQHAMVASIQAPVNYCPPTSSLSGTSLWSWLRDNWRHYRAANLRLLRRRPWAYLRTLGQALWMSLVYRDSWWSPPRKVFIKEFLQAGHIAAAVLAEPRIGHLHGHFCHGATTITWFVSRMTGIGYSFTAHAKDIYQKRLNPGDLLERKIRCARFVVTCTGANHVHLQALSPQGRCVHTVYHGLDTEFFGPSPGTHKGAVPLILAVGRFVEKKGFDLLVEACGWLQRRGLDFRCLIIGEPGEAYGQVCSTIAAHGLAGRVQLGQAVTQTALRELYHRATVFALPCRIVADGDRDGIPNVLVEAMSTGLACLSTTISGIPELIEHGHNGLLVAPDDSQALARALAELLGDGALRERLGRSARQTVLARFDSRRTTERLQRLMLQQLQPTGTGL